jgi:hypothetical protein
VETPGLWTIEAEMIQILEMLSDKLTSAALTAFVLALPVWLLRNWIYSKLSSSIRHEYDRKIEILKSDLSLERERDTLVLKEKFTHQQKALEFARSAMSAAQSALVERRVAAIDAIWNAVLESSRMSALHGKIFDSLTLSELRQSCRNPGSLMKEITWEKFNADLEAARLRDLDVNRPYVGDAIFLICELYVALRIRLAKHLLEMREDPQKEAWFENHANRSILLRLLDGEQMQRFRVLEFGHVSFMEIIVEQKISGMLADLAAGAALGHQALRIDSDLQDLMRSLGDDLPGSGRPHQPTSFSDAA